MTAIEFDAAVDRDAANHPPHPNHLDIDAITVRWPDGTECAYEDLEEYLTFMSDDYELIPLRECSIEWSPEDDVPY